MATENDPEVTELLQSLIRNRCVNDGSDSSGGESRSAETISELLGDAGAETERFEPFEGRASVVCRIEGSDPSAPSLCYLAHTDVVPVNESRWERDPFGGELVDGEVWGRGAVDMLNITSSMSLAVSRLVGSGFKPKGTLVFAAVADEEALGTHGAKWLTEHAFDSVAADYVVTETGGIPARVGERKLLTVPVAEKGSCWARLRVTGEPGHASQPFRTDNALVTASEVITRLARFRTRPELGDLWQRFVGALELGDEISGALLDPEKIDGVLEQYPDVGVARHSHACTHTTIAPTIAHGGTKINVIPDTVEIDVDIRTMPGWTEKDVRELLSELLGDLRDKVEIVELVDDPPTASRPDGPFYAELEKLCMRFHPDGHVVPALMVGATDARFFRRKGAEAYGFAMFTESIGFERFSKMFHGDNERIDTDSLAWSAAAYEELARSFLS